MSKATLVLSGIGVYVFFSTYWVRLHQATLCSTSSSDLPSPLATLDLLLLVPLLRFNPDNGCAVSLCFTR